MIAGCPKCGARYRIEREKLASGGVRLRCAKCEAVFRVRAPGPAEETNDRTQLHLAPPTPPQRREVPAPAAPRAGAAPDVLDTSGDCVLVAIPEAAVAKQVADALAERGVRSIVAHDGVEAALELQRKLPKAAVVAAHLPKMFGFQLCELVKRNESLRGTWIVLVGAIHNQERYRRPAGDTYGADAYLEMPDLPAGVLPLLERGGVTLTGPAAGPRSVPAPAAKPSTAVPRQPVAAAAAPSAAVVAPSSAPTVPSAAATAREGGASPSAPRARAADGLDEQRAKAERLARIIVSDIVLYNEPKFAEAIRRGNVVEALDGDLAEGRHLFQERIDARVRAERDYLAEELVRIAKQRGLK